MKLYTPLDQFNLQWLLQFCNDLFTDHGVVRRSVNSMKFEYHNYILIFNDHKITVIL